MIKNGGSKPPPYDKVFSWLPPRGGCRGDAAGGEYGRKNNNAVNHANAGSFRHGSAVPPPSRREA